jgi:hypothetical protein
MIATNNNGSSIFSTDISYNTPVPSPTNLTATGSRTTTINVSFTPPSIQNITSYTIKATTGTTVILQTVSASASTYTITGLVINTQYTINITTNIGTISSLPSNTITFSTINDVYTNITFPNSYATFTASDTNTNTSLNKIVTGSTSYLNGTYTVLASSATNTTYHPCLAFCNTPGTSGWFATSFNSGWLSQTRVETSNLFTKSYTSGGIYQGGSYGIPSFTTPNGGSGEWIQITLPYSLKITQMNITTTSDFSIGGNYTLQTGTIVGSNDKINWVLIKTINGGGVINISTSATYTSFRLVINSNKLYGERVAIQKITLTGTAYII